MNTHDPFANDDASGATPPSDEVRAGEYVLGVLDASERSQAQVRIDAEPAFAALVERWDQYFASWLLQVEAVAPAAHVWPRIRTELGWPSVGDARGGVWNSLPFWRAATGLAVAAGLAAVVIGLRPPAPTPAPPTVVVQPVEPPAIEAPDAPRPVTVLARDDGSTGWVATIDPVASEVLMVPVPVPADPAGRVHELWLIAEGAAPQSLGQVSGDTAHTIEVPAALRDALAVGATLAITLEPEAGIPHAAPTGPIVAKGGIARI
ncbi:anti-sigma factor [Novilysobacter erysipheiresistens]|uniref:Anti-sigma factor n=1 Tax=Novilysobacter erysipheiresistens TaxID=1749332 RepID=A0ABU7YXR2_9GAMM